MKITLDLETFEITAPKRFFEEYAKKNDILRAAGVEEDKLLKPMEEVKKAFNEAMSNTDKYFKTRK